VIRGNLLATACAVAFFMAGNTLGWAHTLTLRSVELEAGRKIYNFRCYFCHGYSGNAKTVAAEFLTPRPVDFTHADPVTFTVEHVAGVVKAGKPGTAMQSFQSVLSKRDIQQLAEFVVDEFVRRKAVNTTYHTPANGWPNHQRYQAAFPFATGEIPISRAWESLNAEQTKGKKLFLSSCVVCHDRADKTADKVVWESRPLSYPRNDYVPTSSPPVVDAMSSASPYLLHEIAPKVAGMNAQELLGEKLFQGNCAFCHGADGTGKNWIGSFLEPHPRNLQDPTFMQSMTRAKLDATIHNGLPGTSMPAWKRVLSDAEIAAIVSYVAKAIHPLAD
jgi:cytochrome c oxidase cbb3-type subunit III